MNPSTDDILKAVDSIYADNIFILCNNKNIIAAANKLRLLLIKYNCYSIKSIPGITSMITFNSDLTVEENQSG